MYRLRFAPSPTGYLHVGGLRTALFSYLFAKHHQGSFIFRLEDTDQQRLVAGSESNLLEMLRWAGLVIDEGPGIGGEYGPYRQSERLAIYQQHGQKLLDAGYAYYCFCTTERLENLKRQQKALGLPTGYDGLCRNLTPAEVTEKRDAGLVPVLRMKLPETKELIRMQDLIRGVVVIESDQLDDQVLIKSDGFPTYHLAVVVDDHLMKITHVVRGEEWLPSYPKHILLYRYFQWEPPQFAHLPLILNPDRSKLSKRQGDVAVEDYRQQGYLPEALVNFIALLGWNTSDEQEIFSMAELIEKFSFERVGKAGAIFDREKLNWMNQQYLKKLSPEFLFAQLQPFVETTRFAKEDPVKLAKVCRLVQTSLVRLTDIEAKLSLFFDDKPELNNPVLQQFLKEDKAKLVLTQFRQLAEPKTEWSETIFKELVKQIGQATGLKGKDLWTPLRYALTFEEHGPDLAGSVEIFGKEKCLRMIDAVLSL